MSTSVVTFNFPTALSSAQVGDTGAGFSVEAEGEGSFQGLSYSVPAHSKGHLKATINTLAITTADVAKLNTLIMGMLSASERSKVTEHEETRASADISIWSIFGSSGSAGYSKTKDTMHSMGLNDDQISTIIAETFKIANTMSSVSLDFEIDNLDNDYSVYGDLQLYTISGKISSGKETVEYRFLANKGSAGAGADVAPAAGNIIPLS